MENLHFQTPPDTLAFRRQLSRHRAALEDVQNEIFQETTPLAARQPFKANDVTISSPDADAVSPDAAKQGLTTLEDLVLYKNPPVSLLAIIVASFAFTTAKYIVSGPHQMTALSALCYAMLFEMAVSLMRSVFAANPAAGGMWRNSRLADKTIEIAAKAIDSAAALHDRYMTVHEPVQAFKMCCCLWGLALIGRWVSIWTLVASGFVFMMTMPFLVNNNWEAVQGLYGNISTIVVARGKALGLNRKQQVLLLLGMLTMLWMHSSWSSRFIGMLTGALFIRCHLKPAEMAALRHKAGKMAAPLTVSVKKSAARFSIAASGFAVRNLGNRSHAR